MTFIFALSFMLTVCAPCDVTAISGYYSWEPSAGQLLSCPLTCKTWTPPGKCCACEALPCWDIDQQDTNGEPCGVTKGKMFVERLNHFSESIVINATPGDVSELIGSHAMLTNLPTNICSFSEVIVKVDLRNNKLKDIRELRCLRMLDTCHLDNNLIETLPNTTFAKMNKLRVLTLAHNNIGNLEPNVFKIGNHNIMFVDISHNYLDSVDVSNLFPVGVYCNVSIQHSYAAKITNKFGYKLAENHTIGPGKVFLQHTRLQSLPNFTDVGIHYTELSKYFRGSLHLDSSSLHCDCRMYPFLKSLGKEAGLIWSNIDNNSFICNSPEHIKGYDLANMLQTSEFERLVCVLENCPHSGKCQCIDKPHEKKILVNCTGAGLSQFPDEMPVGYWDNKNIYLILANNSITEIPDRNYMDRLIGLDLADNRIHKISPNALDQINDNCKINIPDQELSGMISEFENKNPQNINFGKHPVPCDCSNLWIGDWIRMYDAPNVLKCDLNENGISSADSVTVETLGCLIEHVSILIVIIPSGVIISLIILTNTLCYLFRYDILIALRKIRRKQAWDNMFFDVFISFDEDNIDVFQFVAKQLKPGLERSDYMVFIPWFNLTAGVERDKEIMAAVEKSRNFVIVLSLNYFHHHDTKTEFNTMWNNFKTNKATQIVVINYDNMNSKDINDKRLNALRRTSSDVSYREREGTLLGRLKHRLGTPHNVQKMLRLCFDNY